MSWGAGRHLISVPYSIWRLPTFLRSPSHVVLLISLVLKKITVLRRSGTWYVIRFTRAPYVLGTSFLPPLLLYQAPVCFQVNIFRCFVRLLSIGVVGILLYNQFVSVSRWWLRDSRTSGLLDPSSSRNSCCSKQSAVSVWQMPVAVCTVSNSWWWTERPSETCRAFLSLHRAFRRDI